MDRKILTTAQVRELAAAAQQHDFNRQLAPGALDRLDDDKYHIATLVLFWHDRGNGDPLHHRVRLLLGMRDRHEPREAWLDVTDEDWAPLPDADSVP